MGFLSLSLTFGDLVFKAFPVFSVGYKIMKEVSDSRQEMPVKPSEAKRSEGISSFETKNPHPSCLLWFRKRERPAGRVCAQHSFPSPEGPGRMPAVFPLPPGDLVVETEDLSAIPLPSSLTPLNIGCGWKWQTCPQFDREVGKDIVKDCCPTH